MNSISDKRQKSLLRACIAALGALRCADAQTGHADFALIGVRLGDRAIQAGETLLQPTANTKER